MSIENKANTDAAVPLSQLREAIRQELWDLTTRIQPDKEENKLWSFLNSGVGLWLLSSVVLAGITAAYSSWSAYIASEEAAAQQFSRLDAEIELRYRRTLPAVLEAIEDRKPDTEGGLKRVRSAFNVQSLESLQLSDIFLEPDPARVYQRDYRNHNVLSILAEAQSIARTEQERQGIRLAISHIETARRYYDEANELAEGRLPRTGRFRVTLQTEDGTMNYREFFEQMGESIATEEEAEARFRRGQIATARSLHLQHRPELDTSILKSFFFWKRRAQLTPSQVENGPTDEELAAVVASVGTGPAPGIVREVGL